jgi:hypothetical protein
MRTHVVRVPGSISCINASGEQATQRSQVRVEVPSIQHINRNNIKRVLLCIAMRQRRMCLRPVPRKTETLKPVACS